MQISWGPDINVCVKPLTHAFTSRSWIRISSGLENLVTRLSQSDSRGPDHQRCSDSLSNCLDSQSSLFPIKRRVGLGTFFSFLEDLMLFFPSYSCLVECSKLPLSGCTENVQDCKSCKDRYHLGWSTWSQQAYLGELTAHILTPNSTLLGGLSDLSVWHCPSDEWHSPCFIRLLWDTSHRCVAIAPSYTFHIHSILQIWSIIWMISLRCKQAFERLLSSLEDILTYVQGSFNAGYFIVF